MTKPDWADKKAHQHLVNIFDQMRCAKLLRQERARAVRVCRKLAKYCDAQLERDDSPEGQAIWSDKRRACLDCVAAIAARTRRGEG